MKYYFLPFFILFSLSALGQNDPFFGNQWGLNNDGTQKVIINYDDFHAVEQLGKVGVDIGWLKAQGLISKMAVNPVTIAVIDSGVDLSHPDLTGRISPDAFDFLGQSSYLTDPYGHGTILSGIMAANSNNSIGIAGIAPSTVKILPLRVLGIDSDYQGLTYLNTGRTLSDYVADAIKYAITKHADIINLSLGWPKLADSDSSRVAIQAAVKAGILIIAAAGNDHKVAPQFPCAEEGVLCVGAITNTGGLSYYSNFGGLVDLVAPGDDIYSTYPLSLQSTILRIQGYEKTSGTSVAAPFVSAMAAIIKSAFPKISVSELKARLLSSDSDGQSLYGLPNITETLTANPHPVFYPHFKTLVEVPVNEKTLKVQGVVPLENLWAAAHSGSVQVLVNSQPAGTIKFANFAQGQTLNIPWSYQFESLDDPSNLKITLTITAQGLNTQTFTVDTTAVRTLATLKPKRQIAIQTDTSNWFSTFNGFLAPNIKRVMTYNEPTGMPFYYFIKSSTPAGSDIAIFDSQGQVSTLHVPLSSVNEVMRVDLTGAGTASWVVDGLEGGGAQKLYFSFYFFDPHYQLSGLPWKTQLGGPFDALIQRSYTMPGSWVAFHGSLIPAFVATGPLPDAENFDIQDQRHYQVLNHIYYLSPQTAQSGFIPLVIHSLDNMSFRQNYKEFYVLNPVPISHDDAKSGHLRLIGALGTALDSASVLVDVPDVTAPVVNSNSNWNYLLATGTPVTSIAPDFLGTSGSMLGFYDEQRGRLTWTNSQGLMDETTEFEFDNTADPITAPGLLGQEFIPALGQFWFIQTKYNLVAYHHVPHTQSLESDVIGLERDSTMPGQLFSQSFSPVIVGSDVNPEPGLFVDSTRVRGDLLSVVIWNGATRKMEKPLRHSFQTPPQCFPDTPIQISQSLNSYELPLFCQQNKTLVFKTFAP